MPVVLQRADQLDADHQFGRIEPGEPFVEQQQPRLQRQRARELEPLAVDIGEVGRRPLVLSAKTDALQQQVDPRLRLAADRCGFWKARPALMFSRQFMPSRTRTSWKVRASPRRAIR